jgi:quaternary ammonium compound-resistance protein SugE
VAWIYLLLAGVFEVVWVIALKLSEGFTRPGPSAVMVAALAASMLLLGLAVRTLPLGMSYAIWTGVGAAGAVIYGMMALGEPMTALRLFCVALILAGIAGLRLTHIG